jgi:DNA-binding CsgD family transcriptional regulator
LAGAHALNGDRDAMESAISHALAADPGDHRVLADLYGRVLATAAFVDDQLERLPELMTAMIEHVRRADPARSVYPGRMIWVVLEATDAADGGADARAEFAARCVGHGFRPFDLVAEMAEAIALGRLGDAQPATDRFEAAYDELSGYRPSIALHPIALIAARAARRDGWGDPVRWLRGAEAVFDGGGYRALARRCRVMLREAGAPMPRHGRGESTVPVALRARGVTSREMDVVELVIAGRTNKQIAAELYLSPKTVERHVSSLFTRLAVTNRRELAAAASEHLITIDGDTH